MRVLVITIFILGSVGFLFGQDGSNINYVKPEDLSDSQIGRIVQIDFYRKSRGLLGNKQGGMDIDKVQLDIDGKQVEFVEHREDDGFNNWFSEQYLETADKKLRIKEFKLLKIEEKTILVEAHLTAKPFIEEFSFKKSDIAQILFKQN